MINYLAVARVLGILLSIFGAFMLSALPFALHHGEGDAPALLYSALCCLVLGLPSWLLIPRRDEGIRKREGYLVVAVGWLMMGLFGALPYLLSDVAPAIPDALFESISGLTTTGATVLTDIEATPKGILFWRSLTQWIGGMGIIALTVAIFPLLGIGGIELFVAEAPGPTSDKLHPRIRETAKRLWYIYVGLTAALTLILHFFSGLGFYDAINHALTTMATGGFSTKADSLAHWNTPSAQYPIALFMFISGNNFTATYFALKGRWRRVWSSDEFKAYLAVVAILTLIVALRVFAITGQDWEPIFRHSLFQVIAIVTTTGFVCVDYTQWTPGLTMLFFLMMFLGACAGSTSGGIKLVRHLVFFKNSYLEFKRIVHPRAVVPLKLNGQIVAPRIMTHIIIFLLLYMMLFVAGSIVCSIFGLDFLTAVGAAASSLSNVGPGIGGVGPVDDFAWLPWPVKLTLAFLMLLGRLEIFTILVLFTPFFWKSN
jgi:trk system potassium uptake protein TrkH